MRNWAMDLIVDAKPYLNFAFAISCFVFQKVRSTSLSDAL